MKKWFHDMANEGKAITDYRKKYPCRANFPASRIEVFIKLEQLKKLFQNK